MIDLIKEAQLTLESIRADIVIESQNLSALYKEKEALEASKTAFSGETAITRAQIDADRAEIASERANLTLQREQMAQEQIFHTQAINELKTQEKLSLKDLGWVNDKVLKAEELIKEKNHNIVLLDEQIELKKKLVENITGLENTVNDLEDQKDILLKEHSLEQGNATEFMKKQRAELESILEKKDLAVEQANQAEYNLKTYTDKRVTMEKDFAIYVQRLEEHYQKAFPELHITI